MRTLLVLVFLLTQVVKADEVRDFGIRIGAGALQGIDDRFLKELSVYADMYFLSQSQRLIFGFSLYEMSKAEVPGMSIQSIGIEQNIAMADGQFFLGALYNKTYLKNENSGFDPQHGLSFQLGYKYPLQRYQELVIIAGQQYQPVKIANNKLTTQLEDRTIYFRLASEWYF